MFQSVEAIMDTKKVSLLVTAVGMAALVYACNSQSTGEAAGGESVALNVPAHGLTDNQAKEIKYVLMCNGQNFTVYDKDIKNQTNLVFTGTEKVSDGQSCSMQIKGTITESYFKMYTWPSGYTAGSEQVIFESPPATLVQRKATVRLKSKYTVSEQNSFSVTVKKIISKDSSITNSAELTFTSVSCPEVNVRPEGAKGWGPVTFKLPKNVFNNARECTFTAETKNPTSNLQGKLNIGTQSSEYESLELWKTSGSASTVSSGSIEVEATIEKP
jgi:hypothetical protein